MFVFVCVCVCVCGEGRGGGEGDEGEVISCGPKAMVFNMVLHSYALDKTKENQPQNIGERRDASPRRVWSK